MGLLIRGLAGQQIFAKCSGVPASYVVCSHAGGVFVGTGSLAPAAATTDVYEITLAAGDTNSGGAGAYSYFLLDGFAATVGEWNGTVLDALPSTGDPMAASVPGTYTPGQAGFLIGSALAALSGVLPATANAAIAVEMLDKANGIEAGLTVRQALRLIAASLTGKLAIAGGVVTIKGAGVNTDRVAATTDAAGQRLAVTLTP